MERFQCWQKSLVDFDDSRDVHDLHSIHNERGLLAAAMLQHVRAPGNMISLLSRAYQQVANSAHGGKAVVGALPLVDIVVGVHHRLVPEFPAQNLYRAVGNHLKRMPQALIQPCVDAPVSKKRCSFLYFAAKLAFKSENPTNEC